MAVWTITYNDGSGPVEKAAADWGLNAQPVIRTRDRTETVFSFRMAGANPAGSIPFPFKAEVTIRQNRTFAAGVWSGAGWVFKGYQMTQKGRVDGARQGIMLDFGDAIWLLKNTTFQQNWNVNTSAGGGGVTTTAIPVSRCVLFMDINSYVATPWTLKSVQWQINEIITFAASCGISIQAGTIDYSGFEINYYHVRAISCWDALLKCLEPIPDAKVWVDASTTPPSLHVRTRANLAALAAPTTTAPGPITLPWRGTDSKGRKHSTSELTPRHDLIPPQVVIQYQVNNTLNGRSSPSWTSDVYPPGSNGKTPFAMVVPIDLTGASFNTVEGQLDCEPLACVGGSHVQKRAWWASKRGGEQDKLIDTRVRFGSYTILDATVTDDNGNPVDLAQYPNRLVNGAYHAWMKNGGTQINVIRAHVRVKVQWTEWDVVGSTPAETDLNGNLVRKASAHELHCHIKLTNSPAGVKTYSGLNVSGVAESPASNLAQNIYNSRKDLDYDGDHEIVDPGNAGNIPLSQIIGHWNVLNISGGAAAWATANMTIAGTEIDLVTNHQRIEIGPSRHLSPQDWNEMLQFFRSRRVFIFAGRRATGYGDDNANVDMARNTPEGNTVEGLSVETMQSLISTDAVDATRSNIIEQDASTGQIKVSQKKTSDGTPYTSGIIATTYKGAGAPSASTLAASAYYRVDDQYRDTAANALYVCTTAGDKASSVWAQISGGSGGSNWNYRGMYDPAATSPYMTYDVVQFGAGTSAGLYLSTIDGNNNAPDSGIGWVQVSTGTGTWL
jgi:hypothetical protein